MTDRPCSDLDLFSDAAIGHLPGYLSQDRSRWDMLEADRTLGPSSINEALPMTVFAA